ncbi:MAG: hypothetical protein WC341_12225 [Bacteroidales bacterium]
MDDDTYWSKEDGSLWQKKEMIDLGWGKENGFCRLPILDYEHLKNNVLNFSFPKKSRIVEDEEYNFYGSLSVLIYDYPDRFFEDIEELINSGNFNKEENHFLLDTVSREYLVPEEILERLANKHLRYLCEKWKKITTKLNI